MLSWATAASAALVVNDTWLDGTDDDPASPVYSENGVDADADGDLESAWYQGGGGELNPVGPGGPLHGTVELGGSSSWTSYFKAEGDEVTLTNPGDRLQVTWVFTTGDVNPVANNNDSQSFRLALVDSPAASRITDDSTPDDEAYTGYAIFANMSETFEHDTPFELIERGAGADGNLLSSSGEWETDATLGNGGTAGNIGYTDNTEYTLSWTITRNALDNLDIEATMRGGNIDGTGAITATALNLAPNNGSYSFDTFHVRPSSSLEAADVFDTSLFRVDFAPIPEPTSLLLFTLAGVALAAVRRR